MKTATKNHPLAYMTEEQLKKGQQIQGDLSNLKSSLKEVLSSKLFNISDGAGPFTYSGSADPFLADLEINTRKFAADRINAKIEELEKEFREL